MARRTVASQWLESLTLTGKTSSVPFLLHPHAALVATTSSPLVLFSVTQSLSFPKGLIFKHVPVNGDSIDPAVSFNDGRGYDPSGGSLLVDQDLYGVTLRGGQFNNGTFYRYDTKSGAFAVLHAFGETDSDGRESDSTPLVFNGKIYGTTASGGADNNGTFWEWTPPASMRAARVR